MKVIKCVVIGDGAVGKTCLLINYTSNIFHKDYIPTVFDNYTANVMINNEIIQLSLWDTAGQEDFDKLRPLSYNLTDVFILCFSLISKISYNNISNKWIQEIKLYCPNAKIILVGTQKDMRNFMTNSIDYSEGFKLYEKIKADRYIECSSVTGENIKNIFDEATKIGLLSNKNNIKNNKKCTII